jgi:hypothetical protein
MGVYRLKPEVRKMAGGLRKIAGGLRKSQVANEI